MLIERKYLETGSDPAACRRLMLSSTRVKSEQKMRPGTQDKGILPKMRVQRRVVHIIIQPIAMAAERKVNKTSITNIQIKKNS